jgi:hypothetical protein
VDSGNETMNIAIITALIQLDTLMPETRGLQQGFILSGFILHEIG